MLIHDVRTVLTLNLIAVQTFFDIFVSLEHARMIPKACLLSEDPIQPESVTNFGLEGLNYIIDQGKLS